MPFSKNKKQKKAMKLLNHKGGRTHKVHLIEQDGQQKVQRTFFREIDYPRIKRIYHTLTTIPNMLQVYSITHDYVQNKVLIVHEYVEGGDLRDCGQENILHVGVQMSQQLATLHDLGYIHSDVKTYNTVWNPVDKTARLIDFDCLRKISPPTTWVRISGTLAFACPETIKDETMGKEILAQDMDTVDMFALGATLYHLSTGKTPYEECSEEQDLCTFEICFDDLQGPQLLQDIIKGLLSPDPKTRRTWFQQLRDLDPNNLSISTLSLHTQEDDLSL